MIFGKRKITIRTSILTNFLLGIGIVALSLLTLQSYAAYTTALETVRKDFRLRARNIASEIRNRGVLARQTLGTLALLPGLEQEPRSTVLFSRILKKFAKIEAENPPIYALYLGYPGGDLLELVNLESSSELASVYHAPKKSRWLMIRIMEDAEGKRVRRFDFFDDRFGYLATRIEPSSYHADVRPWYRLALRNEGVVRSEPYLFSNLGQRGITYSIRLEKGAVLAMDFTLSRLNALMRSLRFDPSPELYMFNSRGSLIASSVPGAQTIPKVLQRAQSRQDYDRVFLYEDQGTKRVGMILPLPEDSNTSSFVGFTVDRWNLLKPSMEKIAYAMLVALLLLLLALPLILHLVRRIVRPIYRLMEENRKIGERRFDEVERVESCIVELDQLSDSMVEMVRHIREFQEKQRELLDAFIKLIADAIDTKSPYTGGHCKRVPLIARMLLEEADSCTEGEMAGFHISDEENTEAFERAAWLHDCGKITTPEYVVDKATKLETIHNRIHEIRTRFEVLWRDEEIRFYEALLAGGDRRELEERLREAHAKLLEEFDFIARVNLGGEWMDEEQKKRVRKIATRTWLRHFDNRLGLSEAERKRMGEASVTLPTEEALLSDRPEHRIPREDFDPEEYRRHGFTMEVPELLYDRGEIHNLCIEKGTLTPEERFKINEHIIMTIRMLESLPWPETMHKIPEYAGNHHEHLDGSGYSRSLRAKDLSIPARILAIADVFEALTASDRPYKSGKRLSVALKIMAAMVRDGHLDGELFALFIRSGKYREYAQSHLRPEQCDDVEEEALLRSLDKVKEIQ